MCHCDCWRSFIGWLKSPSGRALGYIDVVYGKTDRMTLKPVKMLFVVLCVSFLLFSIGDRKIEEAHKEEIVPERGTYELLIHSHPQQDDILIANFKLFYDFSTQKGSLAFEIVGPSYENLTSLQLTFPNEFTIYNSSCGDFQKEGNVTKCLYELSNRSGNTTNHIYFHSFRNTYEKDRREIKLNFSGKMYPKGEFTINSDKRIRPTGVLSIIDFNLGEFKCDDDCYEETTHQTNLKFNYEWPSLNISSINDSNAFGFVRYKLNTYNNAKLIKQQESLSTGTGLKIGAVILIIEFLLGLFKTKNRSD